MAIAVTNVKQVEALSGNVKMLTAAITLDTSYPTGGSPGLASQLGLKSLAVLLTVVSTGYILDYIPASDLLKVLLPGGTGAGSKASEVANTTNLSATQVQVFAIGVTS